VNVRAQTHNCRRPRPSIMDEGDDSFLSIPGFLARDGDGGASEADETLMSRSSLASSAVDSGRRGGARARDDIDAETAAAAVRQSSVAEFLWDIHTPGGDEADATQEAVDENGGGVYDSGDDNCRTPAHAVRHALHSPAHVDTGMRNAILADCEPTMTAVLPDPFDSSGMAQIIAFGANPLSPEEAQVLQQLAHEPSDVLGGQGPLAAVVRRLFETVRFQRRELDKVKEAEVHLAEEAIEEERRRHSVVQRRQSLVVSKLSDRMRELNRRYATLCQEHGRCGVKMAENSQRGVQAAEAAEYIARLEAELEAGDNAMDGFLRLAKRIKPDLADDVEPDVILKAIRDLVTESEHAAEAARRVTLPPRVSATADGSPESGQEDLALEHYGERLLELERLLKSTEDRCTALVQEKSDLQLKLVRLERRCSQPVTPISGEHDIDEGTVDLREQLFKKEEAVLALGAEVDKLRDEVYRFKTERKVIDQTALSMRLKLDNLRSNLKAANAACAAAVAEQKITAKEYASLATKHREMSTELTETTYMAVKELERNEANHQALQEKLADRERSLASQTESVTRLSRTVERLETELLKTTEQLARKSRSDARATVATENPATALAVDEADRIGAALLEKTAALEAVKGQNSVLVDTVKALQEECEHWKQGVLTYRVDAENTQASAQDELSTLHEAKQFVLHVRDNGNQTELEQRFLRRLSARLGCHASSSRELVTKLVYRVERLMVERREFEATIGSLQEQIVNRERALHLMRSEYSAENSALKAELSHVENDRTRAVADREAAEVRYLEAVKRESGSFYSVGDDTSRLSLFETGSVTGGGNVTVDFADAAQWDDPSIQAAIKSLDVLIGSKAALDARNKALKEELSRLTQRGVVDGEGSSAAATRAVAIESRTLNEELVGIVALQQQVIQKLRTASAARASLVQESAQVAGSAAGDENDSCMSPKPFGEIQSESRMQFVDRRESLSQAADFLRNQLQSMRSLCEERAQANASLHGVVREMEAEIEGTMEAKQLVEQQLQALQETQSADISRLARAAGTPATIADIELFICDTVASLRSQQTALQRCESRCSHFENRLFNALAQKCVLSHIIYLYVNKYQLDFFCKDPDAKTAGLAKFRRAVTAIIAVSRARRAAAASSEGYAPEENPRNVFLNVAARFNVPEEVRITRTDTAGIHLESAVVALKAIPKLQAAIAQRDKDIARLEDAVAALEVPAPHPLAEVRRNEQPDAFDYGSDVVERKNDLARRLRAARKERDELGLRLMREKRERQALEVRCSKYVAKLSSYQRRLGRAKNEADSQERFYKNAILYLRSKADHAVRNDDLTDLGGVDTNVLLERPGGYRGMGGSDAENVPEGGGHVRKQGAGGDNDISSRGGRAAKMLEDQIRAARDELARFEPQSDDARDLESYIAGLEKAAAQVRRTVALAT
jgi:hypothetical protein